MTFLSTIGVLMASTKNYPSMPSLAAAVVVDDLFTGYE